MRVALFTGLLCLTTVLGAASTDARDKSAYFGAVVGYVDMLTDSGPAGLYDRGLTFGLRTGIFESSRYTYVGDIGIDAGLVGADFDGWYLQVPTAQIGFGAGGRVTMLFLEAGAAPFGIDGLSDDVIVSVFNPRVGLAFQYHPAQWLLRAELQLDHMFRLAGETDVSSFHLRLTFGRTTSLL